MTVLFQLLLAILPQLLKWLTELKKAGKQVSGRAAEQLGQVLWYTNQLSGASAEVGVTTALPSTFASSPEAVGINVARYTELVDRAVALFEAYAKLTTETWDDNLARTVRLLFERLMPGLDAEALNTADSEAMLYGSATDTEAARMAALPPWVLPLVLEIAKVVFSVVVKK